MTELDNVTVVPHDDISAEVDAEIERLREEGKLTRFEPRWRRSCAESARHS
jgi:hypothetical protein